MSLDDNLSKLTSALEVVFKGTATNEERQNATLHLEKIKNENVSSTLALASHAATITPFPEVKYFALTVIEHVVTRRWGELNDDQISSIESWLFQFALSSSEGGPAYIRLKIAVIWAEVAKHAFPSQWMNMEDALCRLWNCFLPQQEIVIHVLESISEDVFNHEDPVVTLRGPELGKACVAMMTPRTTEHDNHLKPASGDGWLQRLCDSLEHAVRQNQSEQTQRLRTHVLRLLEALKSLLQWASPEAVIATRCIAKVCETLTIRDDSVQLVKAFSRFCSYGG